MSEGLRRTAVMAVALAVHWGFTWITVPGINGELIDSFDVPRETLSIGALGLVPWITAMVLVELLFLIRPSWRAERLAGPEGRARMRRWWRYAWLVVALVQSSAMAVGLEQMYVGYSPVVQDPGFLFRLAFTSSLVAGSGVIGVVWL